MPPKSTKKEKPVQETILLDEESDQPDDIESSSDQETIQKKPRKKSTYVLTPARKAQFEKARLARQAKIASRKEERDVFNKEKTRLQQAAVAKELEMKNKKLAKLQAKIAAIPDSSSSEEDIVIQRKKKHKPRRKIVLQDDSSSEDDTPQPPRRKSLPKQEPVKLQPIVQFC
jgi:hypothetical protein